MHLKDGQTGEMEVSAVRFLIAGKQQQAMQDMERALSRMRGTVERETDGAKALDKHGIVKDAREREKAVLSVCEEARRLGLYAADISIAPIKPHKNVEFILFLTKDNAKAVPFERLQKKMSP